MRIDLPNPTALSPPRNAPSNSLSPLNHHIIRQRRGQVRAEKAKLFGRAHRKAAVEKSLDGLRDDPTQRTEGPLEPVFVFPGEEVEELVKDCVEGGPLGPPGAVEFRFIGSIWSAADFIHNGVAWSRPNSCRISGQGDRSAEFCTHMQGALAGAEGMESEHS